MHPYQGRLSKGATSQSRAEERERRDAFVQEYTIVCLYVCCPREVDTCNSKHKTHDPNYY
ncbi:hypothetical protein T06_10115 [Trichinella sp. T6]|nr:hypothetical protein T06_10115 [Trichinella sp. T6]